MAHFIKKQMIIDMDKIVLNVEKLQESTNEKCREKNFCVEQEQFMDENMIILK